MLCPQQCLFEPKSARSRVGGCSCGKDRVWRDTARAAHQPDPFTHCKLQHCLSWCGLLVSANWCLFLGGLTQPTWVIVAHSDVKLFPSCLAYTFFLHQTLHRGWDCSPSLTQLGAPSWCIHRGIPGYQVSGEWWAAHLMNIQSQHTCVINCTHLQSSTIWIRFRRN